jgi:hypothetical protein
MKKTTFYLALGVIATAPLLFPSCDKEDNTPVEPIPVEPIVEDPAEGLSLIQSFKAEGSAYTVHLYNEAGKLRLGYTKVYFGVTDAEGKFVEAEEISAFPEMDMGMHKHSTPRSTVRKSESRALLHEAEYAFLMYTGQGEGKWYYDVWYTVEGVKDSVIDAVIQVDNAYRADGNTEAKVIQGVTAVDGSKKYVVTLVEPRKPDAGINEISAYVHESSNPDYPAVSHFTLKLDPRMTGMNNHSSPNNVDLTWDEGEQIYKGKVNFTMTGYWTINLILLDQAGTLLYGNEIIEPTDPQGREPVEKSSLFFEIEF